MRFLVAIAAVMMSGPALAETVLGQQRVNQGTTRQIIDVTSIRAYEEVRICLRTAPLSVTGLQLTYDTGRPRHIPLEATIRHRQCSPWVPLGGAYDIEEVRVLHERYAHPGPRAELTVIGR